MNYANEAAAYSVSTHISRLSDESLLRVQDVFDASHQLQGTAVICALKTHPESELEENNHTHTHTLTHPSIYSVMFYFNSSTLCNDSKHCGCTFLTGLFLIKALSSCTLCQQLSH